MDILKGKIEQLGPLDEKLNQLGASMNQLGQRVDQIGVIQNKTMGSTNYLHERLDGVEIQHNQQYLELTKKLQGVDDGMDQLRDGLCEKESNVESFASPVPSDDGVREAELQGGSGVGLSRASGVPRADRGSDVGVSRVDEARRPTRTPVGDPRELYPLSNQVPQPRNEENNVALPQIPRNEPVPQFQSACPIPAVAGRGHAISGDHVAPLILPPPRAEREGV